MNKDIFYTHYNRFKFLVKFKKELTLVLPAQEAKAIPPLSQILTQVGLNTNDFCEKFNTITKIFPIGSLVPLSVFYIPKEKNFEICFRPFQLKIILQQYINLVDFKYQIKLLDLFRALIIKSSILNENNIRKILRSILGTLRSYELPVQIVFSLDDFEQAINFNLIEESNIEKIINIIDVETKDTFIENEENEEKNNNISFDLKIPNEKEYYDIKFFDKYDETIIDQESKNEKIKIKRGKKSIRIKE